MAESPLGDFSVQAHQGSSGARSSGKPPDLRDSWASPPEPTKKNQQYLTPSGQKKEKEPLEAISSPAPSIPLASCSPEQSLGLLVGPEVRPWWAPMGKQETTGFFTSFLFHLGLILLLAWIGEMKGPVGHPNGQWLGGLISPEAFPEDLWGADGLVLAPDGLSPLDVPVLVGEAPQEAETTPPWSGGSSAAPLGQVPVPSFTEAPWMRAKAITEPIIRFVPGGGLEARNPRRRLQWALQRGGSVGSENAVERGLRWLAAHQMANGGWDFDHRKSNCPGLCRNPGSHSSTTAATSLALLAFLGAGYTHKEGPYRDTVHRGFYYLLSRGVKAPRGIDFMEGTLYGHGLATIALCEAYAMTGDPVLKQYAQEAIDFIVYAQDKTGGGWRYQPGQPGDTTVTGWQLMALRSGQMAGLNVPSASLVLAWRFLDGVQTEQGALYGYMDPAPRRSTTAIGLLCRMYLGWRAEHPALRQGVKQVAEWGPSAEDIYYNYYATQLLHHWGHQEWTRWNSQIRDYLIRRQATQGHEAGSWYFNGEHTRVGGRLFSTAAAVMTLEVYYRYMPLYESKAVQGGL